uniref:Endonuclease/exonuclease/phosphatase domain-containing protein n=1 Tax=Aegilops tauschii subsp. strangulata TaxID=200361 RepID=A0A452YJP6_AEGTS
EDEEKIAFLQEIRDIRADCPGPWMLCGDFNLILPWTGRTRMVTAT